MAIIRLSFDNFEQWFDLPVLPSKLQIKEKSSNKSYDLNNLGEVTVIKAIKEPTIAIEGFFPKEGGPYVASKSLEAPLWYIAKLQEWRDSGHPMRITVAGVAFPIYMACTIENFEYEERAGEPGDIHYKLELKEYRFRTIQKVEKITMEDGTVVQRVKSKRVDERIKPDHYVVKEDGEDFWGICKRHFNEDGHTKEVQKKNGLPIPVVLKAGQVIQF